MIQSAYGIRMLSARLKEASHKRNIIILKAHTKGKSVEEAILYEDEVPWQGIDPFGNSFVCAVGNDITEKEKTLLIDILNKLEPDLIGITLNSPLKQRAVVIKKTIKDKFADIPIVWGGFEPTINPEESLRYAILYAEVRRNLQSLIWPMQLIKKKDFMI